MSLSKYKSGDVICQDRKCKENSGFEVKRKWVRFEFKVTMELSEKGVQ